MQIALLFRSFCQNFSTDRFGPMGLFKGTEFALSVKPDTSLGLRNSKDQKLRR